MSSYSKSGSGDKTPCFIDGFTPTTQPPETRGAGASRVGTKTNGRVGRKGNGPGAPMQKIGLSKAAADQVLVSRMNHL